MTDLEIIEGLIEGDNNDISLELFFERCQSLFCKIISDVFIYEVDYDVEEKMALIAMITESYIKAWEEIDG